ncbi:hypothetical protein AB4Y45_32905 [Paraburkholderia sp. EG287A]|uniref:hypothetical protein n=1 Tax=Paraburkholderia sp. EG287A TaxID=3237012 RepID=UPI0034D1BABB
MNTTQKLMDALNLWLELSEVDPEQGAFSVRLGGGGLDTWSVKKMHDSIKEALELDSSNTTGVLMLDALSKVYFDNRTFNITQLLADPDRTTEYVRRAGDLRAMVQAPEFTQQSTAFVSNLRSALRMYGMDREPTMALTEDLHEIGYLRRDAFRSIQNLRVDQFLSGAPEADGVLPVYNAWVHQFWNVNSLVEAVCRQPAGVTLSLVRDPDDLQSYFVFAVRNGGNLILLSDVPVHAHPLQKYMSRKPEREFASRTSQNWFPYDLLKLKFDEETQRIYADEARRHNLVPLNQTIDRIKAIGELAPEEVLWTVMMFDLIVEMFWHQEHQAPALSYTAAMIREERPLIDAAQAANLPVVTYPTLALKPLTREDMTAQNVAAAVGSNGGNPNAWLEARYSDKVDPALFNLLDSGVNKLYLPPGPAREAEKGKHRNHELATVSPSHVSVNQKDDQQLAFWLQRSRYPLHALPSTTFGTREELEHNRLFLARHNQAQAIQRLADEEYGQRKDEVIAWWSARVRENLDYLVSLAAAGTLRRVFEPTAPGCCLSTTDGTHYLDQQYHFVRTYGEDDRFPLSDHTLHVSSGWNYSRRKHDCAVTGNVSSYRVLFQPQNAKQLAELAGCEVHDLPDVLQHWSAGRDHDGNHLLSRIDPMAWVLQDPWCQINFRVVLHLSKRGLAQAKKQHPQSVTAGEADALAREALKRTTTFTIGL